MLRDNRQWRTLHLSKSKINENIHKNVFNFINTYIIRKENDSEKRRLLFERLIFKCLMSMKQLHYGGLMYLFYFI